MERPCGGRCLGEHAAVSMPRLAVVSTAVPPASSGQARVLGQLLSPGVALPPIWFTDQPALIEDSTPIFGTRLALKPARFLLYQGRGASRLPRINNLAGLTATVWMRARQILHALRGQQVTAVIGASGSPFDLPAAWMAAERLRVPFAAWLFDDPVMQWPADTPYRGFARWWERLWAGRCLSIAPNEVMAEDFAARNPRARPAILVRNPAADGAFAPPPVHWPAEEGRVQLLYTGSVYGAQADALRNLLAAIRMTEGFDLTLRTAQSAADLASMGLEGHGLQILPHLPHAESLAAQRAADILFLPLAFDSAIPEVIRSSAPAKAAEYLASGRPVLVHAPPGAYVNRLFGDATHITGQVEPGAGLVVDRPDPHALVTALHRLRDEQGLRAAMAVRAARLAQEFRVEVNQTRLFAALEAGRR